MTIKNLNKIKSGIQLDALKTIRENKGKGILAMATGTGKSKIPIDFIKSRKKSINSIVLIVPTEELRDNNWKKEFEKWGCAELWNKVKPICYASASKYIQYDEIDLVILDECHNITENNSMFFNQNICKNIIGLTATLPKEDKMNILKSVGLDVTYSLSLDEAVKLGIVSPYNITVIYTELDDINKNVKSGNKQNIFYTTETSAYNFHNKRVSTSYGKSKQMAVLSRMRFIYNLESKRKAAEYLLENVIPKDKRTLIFTGSIEHANSLCSDNFHSKSKGNSLQNFIDLKINRLSCVEALNEGINIPLVHYGLATQLNSNGKDIVQRLGRLIRLFENHSAHLYILCCKDTVDETWVNNALSEFDPSNIEYITFEQFKKGVENED